MCFLGAGNEIDRLVDEIELSLAPVVGACSIGLEDGAGRDHVFDELEDLLAAKLRVDLAHADSPEPFGISPDNTGVATQ